MPCPPPDLHRPSAGDPALGYPRTAEPAPCWKRSPLLLPSTDKAGGLYRLCPQVRKFRRGRAKSRVGMAANGNGGEWATGPTPPRLMKVRFARKFSHEGRGSRIGQLKPLRSRPVKLSRGSGPGPAGRRWGIPRDGRTSTMHRAIAIANSARLMLRVIRVMGVRRSH